MSITPVTPDGGRSPAVTGYAQVLGGAALFGLAGCVAKVSLDAGIEPARLTALRCTGAALGLFIGIVLTRPALLRVARRDLPVLAVLALCGAALIQWLYFVAIDRLPVGLALLLEFTAPLLVALFSRFVLHHTVDRRVWLALGLALGGLAMVAEVGGGQGLDPVGVAAALGAAGCLAAFYLVSKHTLQRLHPMTLAFWMFAIAAVFWAVAQPWWTFDASILNQRTSLLGVFDTTSVPVWTSVLWLVLLGTLTPYALEIASLQHLTPTTTGVVGMSEPVIGAAIAWVWLGQSLGPLQVIGAAVVLLGVTLVQTVTQPATRQPPSASLDLGADPPIRRSGRRSSRIWQFARPD